jgi:uncharacterized membrane protein
MVSDTLANTTRAAHDVGLAAWLGGSMFGKFALNPAVGVIDDRAERGKVVNAAWNGYNVVNALGLGSAAVGWVGARFTETHPDQLTGTEHGLSIAKDVLMALAVASGIASGVQGARLAREAPEGAVPIETGTEPTSSTPSDAARIQSSIATLGNVNILVGTALVAVNGVLAQIDHSRPPLRRALLRRSS